MERTTARRNGGFSLIELVIVVVIIGIIGAIAIPRLSRGSAGAADSALVGDLAVLRNAIDLYATEHNGKLPTAAIVNELTQYSDITGGTVQATKDTANGVIYGPYLRKFPPAPVGLRPGATGVAAADAAGIGWLYDASTGTIKVNADATAKDSAGKLYSDY